METTDTNRASEGCRMVVETAQLLIGPDTNFVDEAFFDHMIFGFEPLTTLLCSAGNSRWDIVLNLRDLPISEGDIVGTKRCV